MRNGAAGKAFPICALRYTQFCALRYSRHHHVTVRLLQGTAKWYLIMYFQTLLHHWHSISCPYRFKQSWVFKMKFANLKNQIQLCALRYIFNETLWTMRWIFAGILVTYFQSNVSKLCYMQWNLKITFNLWINRPQTQNLRRICALRYVELPI